MTWAVLLLLTATGCGLTESARDSRVAERESEREFGRFIGRSGYRVATEPALTEPVMRITARLLDVARSSSYAARAQEVRWKVTVMDAPDISNAFVTPSGPIVVFTGLFPAAKTEAGLANVLGHEIAHVLEQHSVAEKELWDRTAALAALAGVAVGLAVKNADVDVVSRSVAADTANWLVETDVLPYTREQELAADRLGVELAARAGYDPREALAVLERLAVPRQPAGVSQLSTHPDRASRTAALRVWSSDALILYRGNAPGATSLLADPGGSISAPVARPPTPLQR